MVLEFSDEQAEQCVGEERSGLLSRLFSVPF
jgi:hypothetical protein